MQLISIFFVASGVLIAIFTYVIFNYVFNIISARIWEKRNLDKK